MTGVAWSYMKSISYYNLLIGLTESPLWRLVTWTEISESQNHCKVMKRKPGQLMPWNWL